MSKLIDELYKRSFFNYTIEEPTENQWSGDEARHITKTYQGFDYNEFAAAIVKECIQICEDLDATDSGGYCGDARQCASVIRQRFLGDK